MKSSANGSVSGDTGERKVILVVGRFGEKVRKSTPWKLAEVICGKATVDSGSSLW